MNNPNPQPCPALHSAHSAVVTDQRDRMIDVRSVLACVRCALLNDNKVDVLGAVCLAHDVLHDIIDALDSVALECATKKWFADRTRSTEEN
jgi:hypothetical protein